MQSRLATYSSTYLEINANNPNSALSEELLFEQGGESWMRQMMRKVFKIVNTVYNQTKQASY